MTNKTTKMCGSRRNCSRWIRKNDNSKMNLYMSSSRIHCQRADQHHSNGNFFYDHKRFEDAVTEFKSALALRERYLGRYHQDTAEAYGAIGNSYYRMGDNQTALISYRAWLRILRRLELWGADAGNKVSGNSSCTGSNYRPSYDHCKHIRLSEPHRTQHDRVKEEQHVQQYDSYLTISLQHEKDGDSHREKGEYKRAIEKYREAISIETTAIGSDITLAFLWRKTAFLLGKAATERIFSHSTSPKEPSSQYWDLADRIDLPNHPSTKKAFPYGIMDDVFDMILRGDMCHAVCCHGLASEWYQKASDVARGKDCSAVSVSSSSSVTTSSSSCSVVDIDLSYGADFSYETTDLNPETDLNYQTAMSHVTEYIQQLEEIHCNIVDRVSSSTRQQQETHDAMLIIVLVVMLMAFWLSVTMKQNLAGSPTFSFIGPGTLSPSSTTVSQDWFQHLITFLIGGLVASAFLTRSSDFQPPLSKKIFCQTVTPIVSEDFGVAHK